ncbi:MAG: CCA tRNA nucleotidyltransferase, mitochondrial [Phylliscum demangeonii]|nr:MAG: CCA tRNA nucleotidyltransferase, mitochondrial [Phylliscum demangeonii]
MAETNSVTDQLATKRRKLDSPDTGNLPDVHRSSIKAAMGNTAVPRIVLNDVEFKLKNLLLDVAQHIHTVSREQSERTKANSKEEPLSPPIVLRFTGGWVRDKLLGHASNDIDIAIDKMTGYEFGLRMQEYLEITDNAKKYGIIEPPLHSPDRLPSQAENEPGAAKQGQGRLGGLHKIARNPERSKHLETVATKIFGLEIDLVNLRTEVYTEESRTPQMAFGTAEEDALRREATVNALFYNLNTSSLEDLTGQGLNDMRLGVLRTPLDPYQTFRDDPLRILRLIRFASRLGYTIDPEAEEAMRDSSIQAALRTKISRERVGSELEKMLKGNYPYVALAITARLLTWKRSYTVMNALAPPDDQSSDVDDPVNADSVTAIRSIVLPQNQDKYVGWILASIIPWATISVSDSGEIAKKGKPQLPLPAAIAKDDIKANNTLVNIIASAARNAPEIAAMQRKIVSQVQDLDSTRSKNAAVGRDTLGMAIRRWGPTWNFQALYALLVDISQDSLPRPDPLIDDYAIFLKQIRDMDLIQACSVKPIMTGTYIMAELNARSGPWIKEALDLVVAWQFRHPGSSDAALALQDLKEDIEGLRMR